MKHTEDLLLERIYTRLLEDSRPKSRLQRMKFVIPSRDDGGFLQQITLSEEYVVKVLGISPRILLENAGSDHLNRMILREHLLFEGWWSDAKKKVADWVEDNPITNAIEAAKELKDKGKAVIASLTSIVSSGGDAIGTVVQGASSLLSKGLAAITKSVSGVSKRIKELGGKLTNPGLKNFVNQIGEKIANISQFITNKIREATSGSGWKGMLAVIVAYLGVQAVRGKIQEISQTALDALSGDKRKMLSVAAGIVKSAGESALEGDEDDGLEPAEGDGKEAEVAEGIAAIAKSIKSYAWGIVKDALGKAGEEAVEQLSGPIGWIKKLAEIFSSIAGGVSWVIDNILSAISRATFKPLGSQPTTGQ